jgi:hypothetical protein
METKDMNLDNPLRAIPDVLKNQINVFYILNLIKIWFDDSVVVGDLLLGPWQ